MKPRLLHGLTVLGRSLTCAFLGAFAYSCICSVLVRGDRAIAIHGHFRWPDLEIIPSLTLLMTPLAMPSAIISVLSLDIIDRLPRKRAALAFAASTLVLLPALILAFPWYMSALDTSNDWRSGMMLPAAVYAVALRGTTRQGDFVREFLEEALARRKAQKSDIKPTVDEN